MRKEMGSYRTYSSLVKLQPWFLSLRLKIYFRQKCSLGSCACSEGLVLGQNTLMMIMMMTIVTFFSNSLSWLNQILSPKKLYLAGSPFRSQISSEILDFPS